MDKLIDMTSFPISNVLKQLLKDKTTKKNIIFATETYRDILPEADEKKQITEEILHKLGVNAIQPRVAKSLAEQTERTRKNAEVFTPSWICNKMNNHCDAEWFGRENVFNTECEHSWIDNEERIVFDNKKTWKKYVDSKRLEITCGEAPYIVSRYDTTTGEIIPINHRIGILDRKLRVINENVDHEKEWLTWVERAYQSVYGYEFQGDNLLIARINLVNSFVDYLEDRWRRQPTEEELMNITNIIVWNIWQMDGITGLIPYGNPKQEYVQLNLFDYVIGDTAKVSAEETECRIFDWRNLKKSVTYNSLKENGKNEI